MIEKIKKLRSRGKERHCLTSRMEMQVMSAIVGEGSFTCSAKQQTMSQSSGREDNQSIKNCPCTDMDRMPGTEAEEETGTTGSRVERLIFMSLALTCDLIRHRYSVEAADEVINLLHSSSFNLGLFREMMKSHRECEEISKDVIDQFMEEWKSRTGEMKPSSGTV